LGTSANDWSIPRILADGEPREFQAAQVGAGNELPAPPQRRAGVSARGRRHRDASPGGYRCHRFVEVAPLARTSAMARQRPALVSASTAAHPIRVYLPVVLPTHCRRRAELLFPSAIAEHRAAEPRDRAELLQLRASRVYAADARSACWRFVVGSANV